MVDEFNLGILEMNLGVSVLTALSLFVTTVSYFDWGLHSCLLGLIEFYCFFFGDGFSCVL